jgi:hypothetical protein
MDLDNMKTVIESWNKNHQVEILKIIKNTSNTVINENKSGIYINMTFLPENTIDEIRKYILYVQDQEITLKPFETAKADYKNTFFTEKEYKDDGIYNYNTIQ